MIRRLLLSTVLALGLAGCGDDGSPQGAMPTVNSVLEFAKSLIGTQTCETSQPVSLNGRELLDSETAAGDLNGVSVGCTPS